MIKHENGRIGENVACKYLKKKHYKILERNFRKPFGEIDIIAQKEDVIVFAEVKTRSGELNYGMPCEAVTYTKQQKLIKTAKAYIMENELDAVFSFDIIEVILKNGKVLSVNHIENAFYA